LNPGLGGKHGRDVIAFRPWFDLFVELHFFDQRTRKRRDQRALLLKKITGGIVFKHSYFRETIRGSLANGFKTDGGNTFMMARGEKGTNERSDILSERPNPRSAICPNLKKKVNVPR